MNFCSACGQPVSRRIPANDDRQRYVCDHCQTIHYQNPRVIVGCVPVMDDRILMCRRDIEPRRGYWTLPAGFLENGETSSQGAQRETLEEACAQVDGLTLYTLFDLPHISQVYMFYRAALQPGGFAAGHESMEVGLFAQGDIPWDAIAFPVVTRTLQHFFVDRVQGRFPVRCEVIVRPAGTALG